ncbi:M23 family metallopeptidase [Streptomyces albulus]|nr:M23 family metallopeptidase [Streptomyces noursei]
MPGHRINQPYGVPNARYQAGYHTGDDYGAPERTPVVAVRSGTIQWSNADGRQYGNWIGLRADNGRLYVYCHLSRRDVLSGQKVKAGQRIGRVGSTGNVTGPHLHFEDHPSGPFVYGHERKPAW